MDQDLILIIFLASTLLIILCIFVVAITMLYFKKSKAEKIERKKLESEFAETLLQTQLEIKEQTLQNISHEFHDNFGQLVSLINIYLNVIKKGSPQEADKAITEAKILTKQLIKDIKLLSLDLNGNRFAEIGLLRSLQEEVTRLQKLNLFNIELATKGTEFELPKNTVLIVYRMTQEILNNIIKHSHAKDVLIKMEFIKNLLILVFKDNGRGFNTDKRSKAEGNGLINLRTRAHLIKADLTIQSTLNLGTIVTMKIHK